MRKTIEVEPALWEAIKKVVKRDGVLLTAFITRALVAALPKKARKS